MKSRHKKMKSANQGMYSGGSSIDLDNLLTLEFIARAHQLQERWTVIETPVKHFWLAAEPLSVEPRQLYWNETEAPVAREAFLKAPAVFKIAWKIAANSSPSCRSMHQTLHYRYIYTTACLYR
ncbi:hypothetical protein AOXY_G34505 [Acipenser oxyrinchus oxyrinchus]|uniref:Uncharacterized protein n=1 Tax=Acipenser oxyrinchus oxyrinchus TaxID=40147 RepID=A0AAD8FND9_ACIOX|nr:hypothetical protein AOXY_G34505 [Acipenser oxyrinchus oxyrinchus]